jgi:hypothetical protein
MTASLNNLPTGLRPHTTTVYDMLPSPSIRLIGSTPVVTILDKYANPDDPSALETPTAPYPSPNEPNYYVPLIDPPPPSTLAESITHHLLDRIIHDTMAQDNTTDTRKQVAPAGTTTTHQRSSSSADASTNRATGNSNEGSPAGNQTEANAAQEAHHPPNNGDEQPTKRTRTAEDTTDPTDDTQEFSLRIPLERPVTDTVFQLTDQMFRKLGPDETLQFIHSNKGTIPAPAPFDIIDDFPVSAMDFRAFFHGITLTTKNQRDNIEGTKVIIRIRCTVAARELKRRIFPHLQALDTHMDSKAIWSHGTAQIGWIHSAHPNFCLRKYYAQEISAGFKLAFYDPVEDKHSLEQDRITEAQRTALRTKCPTLPEITVKPFTIRTEYKGNKIDAEVLAVFAPNPVKEAMREALTYLNPNVLGVEKCLISYDYEQHIGPYEFAQMLIHNNVFHNQSTVIPIYNIHPDVLNQTFHDPDPPTDMEDDWCLHQSLIRYGLCSIEPTKDTDTLGKYLCVVSVEKHDNLLRRIQFVFESLMHHIGDGDLADKCAHQYGNTPMAGREARPKDMDSARAAMVLQCLQRTNQRQGLPNINDITQACLVMNTENNTTPRRNPKPSTRRTFAFSNIADVSCANTIIPTPTTQSTTPNVGFHQPPRDSTAQAAPSYSTMARTAQDANSVQSAISSTASPSIHGSQTVATDISALSTVVTQMSAMINTMHESMRQDRIDQRNDRLAEQQNQQQFQHNQQQNQQQFFVNLMQHMNVLPTPTQQSPPSDGTNNP